MSIFLTYARMFLEKGDKNMIQDIAPHVYHNEYKPQPPQKDSVAMCFSEGRLLANETDGTISFPTFGELEGENPHIYQAYTYLFCIDEIRFYLLEGIKTTKYTMLEKRELRRKTPTHLAFAGITAVQLYEWYKSRRFCGKCGKPMKHDKKERMMYCEACHHMEYPKICPAVIVGVTNGNKLLLSKYAGRSYTKYALLAGFAEIGESIEDTVRREVMEEVGLRVKNLTYYKSQPWSFTDTLLFGFYAEVDGSDEIVLDREELALAEWFERNDIPVEEEGVSLTNEMIIKYKKGDV